MPDVLTSAIEMHQTGQLTTAARMYQQLLAKDTEHADALHLLGVLRHQQGDHAKAVELIIRAIALRPSVAAFHANLAEAYRALGQLERAAGCCRTALRLQPTSAPAANNLGLILLQQGETDAAITHFEMALRLDRRFAVACNNLGNAWLERGDKEQALTCFRRSLQMDPNLARAHSNLGQLLLEQGELDEALVHCRTAVRLCPDSAEVHNNLGNVLREKGQLVEARACYAEALRLNPDLALTLGNMGQVFQQERNLTEAIVWYKQALRLEPNSAHLHCYLAGALVERENYEDGCRHYETALRIAPDYAEAHNGLGWVRHERGDLPQAREDYGTALRLKPDYPAARCNLALLLTEIGDFSAAEEMLRAVLAEHDTHAMAYAQLATLLRGRLPEPDRQAMQRLLADRDTGEIDRLNLHFGLARLFDARGAYAQAVEHLRHANVLARATQEKSGRSYNPAEHARFVDNLIAAFSADFFARRCGHGLQTDRPVFIVGLPRSGTTLTEQILANHSRVFAAGELPLGRQDFLALSESCGGETEAFEALSRGKADVLDCLARRHLEQLQGLNGTVARVVDKMPDNYLYLGLLATLFPQAKFIHCRRDPRDVALSCWMAHFRHVRWANDFAHIVGRIHDYHRLMAHWQQVLPVPLLEVDYEETVTDLEGVARRLVDWCGLDWEPACLDFHKSKRPVRTASATQVRQPLYTHSVGRWRNYEHSLAELFAALTPLLCPRCP